LLQSTDWKVEKHIPVIEAADKVKKGQKFACAPCGREVIVDACGISRSTIWCCDKPMKAKSRLAKR